ncbi:ParB N-terminal domain-containing protein [Microbacterium sp. G2-8]|uniref:ParB/RepB/Spo0J family partition protein n=1 Tax=Microbacterium sp. G2-8 TaxID=2842454 RepID=UPI001C890E2E|nr:ParB N-terminal domain-containing protein [Microbacterium sp. G2-8]
MAITYDPETADIGEVVKIPAADLVIDPNVRTDIRLDKSFISSIRQHGFEQYPVGWRDDDGHVHITTGQRRTSAALEIGWSLVPVVIKPKATAEGDRAEELRILTQLRENEQRAELASHETAAAYQQLALFGVSEDQIARKTNSTKQKVTSALRVAGSESAAAAASAYTLTLEHAAVIAEFDGDADAVEQLTEQAEKDPAQLEHVAQRIREDRLDQEVIDRLKADVLEAGATPLTSWAERDELAPRAELFAHLCRADDPDRKALELSDLAGLEQLFGWIRQGHRGDADRGYTIDWYVNGWKKQGLAQRYTYSSTPVAVTDEEKEAERERKRTKREAKAAMRAATVVRREWIRDTLLARGAKHDKTHQRYVAGALLGAIGHLRHHDKGEYLALDFLRTDDIPETGHYPVDPITGHHIVAPGQLAFETDLHNADPVRVALAVAIAQTEDVVGEEKADGFGQDPRTARYLMQLRDWGYQLADVELAIVTDAEQRIAAAQADDETDAEVQA